MMYWRLHVWRTNNDGVTVDDDCRQGSYVETPAAARDAKEVIDEGFWRMTADQWPQKMHEETTT